MTTPPKLPTFMYGTAWKEDRTEALTRLAITEGFRAIDTANQRKHYFEAGVGAAIAGLVREGAITRDALFLQTKFTYARGQDHRLPYDPKADLTTQVRQSFTRSLEHLGTSYIDSLVLHGPSSGRGLDRADEEVWRTMEALVHEGHVRMLGVSNVSLDQLGALMKLARVRPAFVQNRCYARDGWDREVRARCRAESVVYQGFSLLTANTRELESDVVTRLCARTGLTRSGLVFRFARDVGMIPLTGTSDRAHMREDLDALEGTLDAEDVRAIERLAG